MTLLPIECPRVNGCKSSSSKSEKDPASAIRNDARPNLGASAPLSLRSAVSAVGVWPVLCPPRAEPPTRHPFLRRWRRSPPRPRARRDPSLSAEMPGPGRFSLYPAHYTSLHNKRTRAPLVYRAGTPGPQWPHRGPRGSGALLPARSKSKRIRIYNNITYNGFTRCVCVLSPLQTLPTPALYSIHADV